MHQTGLLMAIRYFGSQEALGRAIGVSRKKINNWLNRDTGLSLESAIKIAHATAWEIGVQLLVPDKLRLIHYLQQAGLKPCDIMIDHIKTDYALVKALDNVDTLSKDIEQHGLCQPIVVSETYHLLYGIRRLAAHQALKKKTIKARVISIHDIFNSSFYLKRIIAECRLSERVCLAHALRQYIYADSELNWEKLQKQALFASLSPEWDKLSERLDEWLPVYLNIGKRSHYYAVKKIIKTGITALIAALDSGKISVFSAAKIACLPEEEQKAHCFHLFSCHPKAIMEEKPYVESCA